MTDLGAAAKLRAAFELSPTILAVSDLADGRMLGVNDAFLRATGHTRDEIIGRRIPDLGLWIDPGLREDALAGLRAGRPVRDLEARFRTKSSGPRRGADRRGAPRRRRLCPRADGAPGPAGPRRVPGGAHRLRAGRGSRERARRRRREPPRREERWRP